MFSFLIFLCFAINLTYATVCHIGPPLNDGSVPPPPFGPYILIIDGSSIQFYQPATGSLTLTGTKLPWPQCATTDGFFEYNPHTGASSVVLDGFAYVSGGFHRDPTGKRVADGAVTKIDGTIHLPSTITNDGPKVAYHSSTVWKSTSSHGAVQNNILMCGGMTITGTPQKTCFVMSPTYDVSTTTVPQLPIALTGHTMHNLPGVRNRIYSFGGKYSTGSKFIPLSVVLVLNEVIGNGHYAVSWDNNKTPMPTPVYNHASVDYMGGVLVCGGQGSTGFTNKCQFFNPRNGTWSVWASLNAPRSGHAMVVLMVWSTYWAVKIGVIGRNFM